MYILLPLRRPEGAGNGVANVVQRHTLPGCRQHRSLPLHRVLYTSPAGGDRCLSQQLRRMPVTCSARGRGKLRAWLMARLILVLSALIRLL